MGYENKIWLITMVAKQNIEEDCFENDIIEVFHHYMKKEYW